MKGKKTFNHTNPKRSILAYIMYFTVTVALFMTGSIDTDVVAGTTAYGSDTNKSKSKSEQDQHFRPGERALVLMKNGEKVKVVVKNKVSKNTYWVRQLESSREGKVKNKFMTKIKTPRPKFR